MNCFDAHRALSAHFDEELSDARSEELRRHLADCPACRRYREELGALLAAIQTPAGREPSPYFLQKIRRRIDAGRAPAPLFGRLRWVSATAASVLLAVTLLTGNFFGRSLWSALATEISPDYEVASSRGLAAFADDPEGSVSALYTEIKG
jgi:anti-sigma factor RsiW